MAKTTTGTWLKYVHLGNQHRVPRLLGTLCLVITGETTTSGRLEWRPLSPRTADSEQTASLNFWCHILQRRFQASLLAPTQKTMRWEPGLHNKWFDQFAVLTGNTQENSQCLGYNSYLANDFIINWYHSESIFFTGFLLVFNGPSV